MKWWQKAVIYQIYPRSFQDSNGDGVGDLGGIIQRLGYLKWLGVDAIWISPIYPSPLADFGYDVSDHCDIHPMFGDLGLFDELLEAAHKQGLKIVMDFVPNHTSDQHAWFLESKVNRENPKADWYVWQDVKLDGSVPNNWVNRFGGGSVWAWSKQRGQYYMHSFLKEQPDVNWRHPEAREAMLDVVRFWFDRGVDGVRVDAYAESLKDADFRDDPVNSEWQEGEDPYHRVIHQYSFNTADNRYLRRWLREVTDDYADKVLIGEAYLESADLVAHYGDDDEFHLPYNFQLITEERWDAGIIRNLIDEYDQAIPEWGQRSWVLGNHDRHRVASRVGAEQARMAMMMLLTLRGTPTIYYGDELGMEDVPIPPEKEVDPYGILSPGLGLGRDPERTPMQWDDSVNAGFTEAGVEPWLPVADDSSVRNVKGQMAHSGSMLQLTRKLLLLRKGERALHAGIYQSLPSNEGVFAYLRSDKEVEFVIVLNFTGKRLVWEIPTSYVLEPVLSTYMDEEVKVDADIVQLRPNEGIVLRKL